MLTEPLTHFDRTIVAHPVGPPPEVLAPGDRQRFDIEFHPSWASLVGMHGGATGALVVRAAEALAPDRRVRTVAATFLRPGAIGPATLEVEVLRHGRSLSTFVGHVAQEGRRTASVTITLAAESSDDEWQAAPGTAVQRPKPLAQCIEFTPPPMVRHFEQAQLRLDPDAIPGGGNVDARIAGHVRPLETRAVDAAWLTVIGDWFPPAPFRRLAPPRGGVSIDYTIHLHRTLPADPERWLEGVFDARELHDGIALEHGWLATPDGVPVAETFHTRWVG